MSIEREMINLRTYVAFNISQPKSSPYFNENFWNIVADYFGSKGEFSDDDIEFLHENDYHEDDFVTDEYESYAEYMAQ